MSTGICAAAAAVIAVLAPATAVAGTSAHSASACNISGKGRKLGTTYVTSVTVKGVTCSTALSFVKAYHSCRHKHGVAVYCARLRGYRCSEKRESIATQYDSGATCTNGSRRIVQTYTQNT